jgi:hypothetical protein
MRKSVAAYGDQKTRENSSQFMGQILNGTPLDQVQGVDPAFLDPEAFNFALGVQKQNQANALGYARLAQTGKGKGGKGGAAAASDTIPVAGGVGSEYLTADGQIVPGVATNVPVAVPLKGKAQPLPTAPTVVPVAQPAAQAVPTVEDFRPMPAGGPVRGDETSQVMSEDVPVDPVTPGATSLLAQATSSYGAPVGGGGPLRPVAGPLRGAAVKGTDGGAQIFPEGFTDINSIRALAATDPEAANAALINNQRLQRTLTMTNGLDVQKGNFEAAVQGQKFREGDRKEQEDVRQADLRDAGRSIGTDAIQSALDKASAVAAIPTDLPIDQRIEALKTVEAADKSGLFESGDPNRPVVAADGTIIPPDNAAVQKSNIIASMTATPEGAKSVAEQTSTPEGAAKFEAAITAALNKSTDAGRGLEREDLQHQAYIRQYDLDRNSNPDVAIINDFTKNLKSDADAGTVAQQVMKNPRFAGTNVDINDMASVIERVGAEAKVSPAIAGGMIANSLRGNQPIRDWLKSWVYNRADLSYNPEKLDRLKGMALDPVTGKPTDKLLNDISNLNESDRQRDNFNASWEQLKKAQAQLNKDTGQQAIRGTKESERVLNMSQRFYEAAKKQYDEDRKKFLSIGGVVRQNRGEPAQPGLAVPPPRPQQGPRQGTVNQPNAQQLLQDAIANEINNPALENKRRLGVY